MQHRIWLLTSEVESPQGSGSIHHRQAAIVEIPTDRSLFLLDDPYLKRAVGDVAHGRCCYQPLSMRITRPAIDFSFCFQVDHREWLSKRFGSLELYKIRNQVQNCLADSQPIPSPRCLDGSLKVASIKPKGSAPASPRRVVACRKPRVPDANTYPIVPSGMFVLDR